MIAIGSDHVGFRLKKEIERFLEQKEIVYKDIGTFQRSGAITRSLPVRRQNRWRGGYVKKES